MFLPPQKYIGTGGENVGFYIRRNTLDAEHADLNSLVEFAWDLKDFQLSGGPAWAAQGMQLDRAELFQILAKPTEGRTATTQQFRLMLQTLLRYDRDRSRGKADGKLIATEYPRTSFRGWLSPCR